MKKFINDLLIMLIYTLGFAALLVMAIFMFIAYNNSDQRLMYAAIVFELIIGLSLIAFWKVYSGGISETSIPVSYVKEEIKRLKNASDCLNKNRSLEKLKANSMLLTAYDYEILLNEWANKNDVSLTK